jgi:hypothetical protein
MKQRPASHAYRRIWSAGLRTYWCRADCALDRADELRQLVCLSGRSKPFSA